MSFRKWLPNYGRRARRLPPADPFATRTSREMADVLADLGLIDAGQRVRVRRVYAGHSQRSEGAWSWWAQDERGNEVCGSQWTAREIIKAHRAPGRCVSTYQARGTTALLPETGEMCPHDNLIRPGSDGPCGCRVIEAKP